MGCRTRGQSGKRTDSPTLDSGAPDWVLQKSFTSTDSLVQKRFKDNKKNTGISLDYTPILPETTTCASCGLLSGNTLRSYADRHNRW